MIEVLLDTPVAAPGEDLQGEIVWTPEKDCAPRKITVSLGWRTEGRGDVARDIVASADYPGSQTSASDVVRIPFRGHVPDDAVPSFAGHLIRLVWIVGVRVDLPWAFDETHEHEFTVAIPAATDG